MQLSFTLVSDIQKEVSWVIMFLTIIPCSNNDNYEKRFLSLGPLYTHVLDFFVITAIILGIFTHT